MSFRAFSTVLWYASALFIFGIAVAITIFRNGTPPIITVIHPSKFRDNLPPFSSFFFIWVLFGSASSRDKYGASIRTCQTSFNSVQADTGLYVPNRPPSRAIAAPIHHRMQSARSF